MKIKKSAIILYGMTNFNKEMREKRLIEYKNRRYLELILESVKNYDEIIISNQTNELLGYYNDTKELISKEMISMISIYKELKEIRNSKALVLSCNMPLVSKSLLDYMGIIDCKEQVLIPFARSKIQSFCAIYDKSILPYLKSMIKNGDKSISNLYNNVSVRYIFPRDEDVFININVIEDYLLLKEKELREYRYNNIIY
jgi:molybdopterin-guanine dinucleotide biosynthesis protein A